MVQSRMIRMVLAVSLLSIFVQSTTAFGATVQKRKKSNVSKMVMLGICIDQVLMQQNIQLQLPPINQRPNWDLATRTALVQAATQCKAQMKASATIQTALQTNSNGLIIMPPLPATSSSQNPNIAAQSQPMATQQPPQQTNIMQPPQGASAESGVPVEGLPPGAEQQLAEPTSSIPGQEQLPPANM